MIERTVSAANELDEGPFLLSCISASYGRKPSSAGPRMNVGSRS